MSTETTAEKVSTEKTSTGKGNRKSQALIDNLEVCRLLGVKPDTWRKRVRSGISPLPFTAAGARTYYRVADVKHYLQEGTWPARMAFRGRKPEPA